MPELKVLSKRVSESITPAKKSDSRCTMRILKDPKDFFAQAGDYALFHGKCEALLDALPEKPLFDLIVTSPPYNIGKPYEQVVELNEYRVLQERVIKGLVKRLKPSGSICWQVGNFVDGSSGNRG